MNQLHIEFDIPATLAAQAGLSPENANREVRRIVALFLYEHRRISLGKACELAGLSRWEFFELNEGLNIEQPISEATEKGYMDDLPNTLEELRKAGFRFTVKPEKSQSA